MSVGPFVFMIGRKLIFNNSITEDEEDVHWESVMLPKGIEEASDYFLSLSIGRMPLLLSIFGNEDRM